MLDLESVIKHCEEVAEENEKEPGFCPMKYNSAYVNNSISARKCAEEHRQLAEWLKDYKRLLEQQPCGKDINVPATDAISRQAMLELAEWFDLNPQHFSVANLIDEVENMPPVTPQSKMKEVKANADGS